MWLSDSEDMNININKINVLYHIDFIDYFATI